MFSLPVNVSGVKGQTSNLEYTTLSLYDAYSQDVQTIRHIVGSGNTPNATDITNLNTAINDLKKLLLNGQSSTDPNLPSPQLMTATMAEALQVLFGAMEVIGIPQATLQDPSSTISLSADQIAQLQNIVNPTLLLNGLYSQVYQTDLTTGAVTNALATPEIQHSLQAEVELVYVKEANDVIGNELASLEAALNVTKTSIDNLSSLQNLHNNIQVFDRGSFTTITGFNLASAHGTANAYQSGYQSAASAFFGQAPLTPGLYSVTDYVQWIVQLNQAGVQVTSATMPLTITAGFSTSPAAVETFSLRVNDPFPPLSAFQRYVIVPVINGKADVNDYPNSAAGYQKMRQDFQAGMFTQFAMVSTPRIVGSTIHIQSNYLNDFNNIQPHLSEFQFQGSRMVFSFNQLSDVSEMSAINYFKGAKTVQTNVLLPGVSSVTDAVGLTPFQLGPTIVPVLPGTNPYSFDSVNSFAAVIIAGLNANPSGFHPGVFGIPASLTVPNSVLSALPPGYVDAFKSHYGVTSFTDNGTNTTFNMGIAPADAQFLQDIVPIQAAISSHAVTVDLTSTSPTYGELLINQTPPADQFNNTQALGQRLVAYFKMIQPAMSAVKNEIVSARATLSAQISALSAIATIAGADPNQMFLLEQLKAVRADLATSFRTSTGEITQQTGLRSAMSGLTAWLFDGYNQRNTPNAALAGLFQQHIESALTASQSLNNSQSLKVEQFLYVFEQYYQSASAVLQKLTQIIKDIARQAR